MSRWLVCLSLVLLASCGRSDAPSVADAAVDSPDADPYCHYDCFGGTECRDGVVTHWESTPVPCDKWLGACPNYVAYTCSDGCIAEGQVHEAWLDGAELCAETRATRPGDACGGLGETECLPTALGEYPDDQRYLRCDYSTHTCALDDVVHSVRDVGAACAGEVDGFAGTGLEGYVVDDQCAGLVCLFADDSAAAGCVRSACSSWCRDAADCPSGWTCDGSAVNRDADESSIALSTCRPQAGLSALACPAK